MAAAANEGEAGDCCSPRKSDIEVGNLPDAAAAAAAAAIAAALILALSSLLWAWVALLDNMSVIMNPDDLLLALDSELVLVAVSLAEATASKILLGSSLMTVLVSIFFVVATELLDAVSESARSNSWVSTVMMSLNVMNRKAPTKLCGLNVI